MPKKFIFILADFVIIVIIVIIMANQIDKFKGLKEVYVAKILINKGVKITPDMVELRKVTLNREANGGKDRVSYNEDVVQKQGDVVGQYAKYDFIAGEIIVKEKLGQTQVATGDQYLFTMPKGYYAYPIQVGDEGKSGLIKTNDYIDLYVTSKEQGLVDEPALRHLRVFDLKSDKGQSVASDSKDENGQPIKPQYIILGLNDYQLKQIVTNQAGGAQIRVALRRRPQTEYEVFNNDDIAYPPYSLVIDQLIDETQEQQLIDQNKFKLDNKNFENSIENSSEKTN